MLTGVTGGSRTHKDRGHNPARLPVPPRPHLVLSERLELSTRRLKVCYATIASRERTHKLKWDRRISQGSSHSRPSISCVPKMAGSTGFEPVIFSVTRRRGRPDSPTTPNSYFQRFHGGPSIDQPSANNIPIPMLPRMISHMLFPQPLYCIPKTNPMKGIVIKYIHRGCERNFPTIPFS